MVSRLFFYSSISSYHNKMFSSILSLGVLALSILPALAVPQWQHGPPTWAAHNHSGGPPTCTEANIRIRQNFDSMAPGPRKAYTDAVLCLMDQPSQLDPVTYPAATNRFFDYAVIHVSHTKVVHLNGYFLTWHRYFLHLYEEDLRSMCGYQGSFPYWNWVATSSNLAASAVFDGSEYSMSGNGIYNNTGPVILSPKFQLPHGTGGGCVIEGPFANLMTTMLNIPITVITEDQPLPATAFDYNPHCLTRDLNQPIALNYTTPALLELALAAPDIGNFSIQVNGVLGAEQLGLHSGAHFQLGAPASSLFVSPMDPIWYPLHAMLDHLYTSWQLRHPAIANTLTGTMTALDLPPSDVVTLESLEPDWGYLHEDPIQVKELISTTAGPFCYRYDVAL